jgi:hypothetical protein
LIPVIELLLVAEPGDNEVILDLLFTTALVHGLDKLRMHTEATVKLVEHATKELGRLLRKFAYEVCSHYHTTELPKEERARLRRQQEQTSTKKPALVNPPSALHTNAPTQVASQHRRRKEFNLNTYKIHSLGDYPSSIRRAGTTDNWTTQLV